MSFATSYFLTNTAASPTPSAFSFLHFLFVIICSPGPCRIGRRSRTCGCGGCGSPLVCWWVSLSLASSRRKKKRRRSGGSCSITISSTTLPPPPSHPDQEHSRHGRDLSRTAQGRAQGLAQGSPARVYRQAAEEGRRQLQLDDVGLQDPREERHGLGWGAVLATTRVPGRLPCQGPQVCFRSGDLPPQRVRQRKGVPQSC